MVSTVDTADLWRRYKATKDSDLRQRLIVQYVPLARYVVGRMAVGLPTILDSEDIVGHATFGLIDAVERFDPERGLKFETYAIPRIRGSILDAIRRLGNYRRGTSAIIKKVESTMAALEQECGHTPTDEEVARALGLSVKAYLETLSEARHTVVPLDRPLRGSEDDGLALCDIIEDVNSADPLCESERAEMKEALKAAIEGLDERDRTLISLYYFEELSLRECAEVFEVSESRVCQLHARAVLRLRRALAEVKLAPPVPDRCLTKTTKGKKENERC